MESLNDALIACVKALGGSKVVGPMLWPEKMVDAAQRALLDCLNPERPNRLTPDQVALLLRKSRQAGFHDAVTWLLADLGYAPPVPVEPRDEVAELMRAYIASQQQASETAEKIAKAMASFQAMSGSGLKAVA